MEALRNESIFDFAEFSEPITVIGIGATGSHIVRLLTKIGVQSRLVISDGDIVELKNCRNQAYDPVQADVLKTIALAQKIRRWGGHPPIKLPAWGTDLLLPAGILFLCVDSMDTKKMMWDERIKGNSEIPLLIETRMDGNNILIHVLDPCNEVHCLEWERYWYPDRAAVNETGGCRGPVAVLEGASMTADLAVAQFKRYAAIKAGQNDVFDNQIRFRFRPLRIEAYRW